jgi:hypothetical protein
MGKMKEIPIKTRAGLFLKLDDDVAEKIGHWGWYITNSGYVDSHEAGSGTPGRNVRCGRTVIYIVTGQWPPADMHVDHINHDKLDNQISNLRVVSGTLNSRNRLPREGTTSRYKGVHLNKHGSWSARVGVTVDDKFFRICAAATKDERIAAMAYDCIAHKIGGFLLPNFPDMPFDEKWAAIGEGQREQILHSLELMGNSE